MSRLFSGPPFPLFCPLLRPIFKRPANPMQALATLRFVANRFPAFEPHPEPIRLTLFQGFTMTLRHQAVFAATILSIVLGTATFGHHAAAQSPGDAPASAVVRAGGTLQHGGKSFRVVPAGTSAVATAVGSSAGGGNGHGIRQVGVLGDLLHGRGIHGRGGDGCDAAGCDGACGGSCGTADYRIGGYAGVGGTGMHCNGSCGTGNCGGTCGGYETCGGQCGGTCNECGNYGRMKTCCGMQYGHYNGPLCDPCYNPCNNFNNPCAGRQCLPYLYLGLEGLLFGRGGDGDADYDAGIGGRITLGKLPDCARGCEVVLTGLFGFDGEDPVRDNLGIASFSELDGDYDADFLSAEISRVTHVEDFARLRVGGRYVSYNEDFSNGVLTVFNPAGATSPLPLIQTNNADVENNLLGVQIGLDLFYPLTSRLYLDGRGRAGGYVNFAEVDGTFNAVGVAGPIGFDEEDEELAGLFEGGVGVRYLASRRLSLFARGEIWYLTGVATARNTVRQSLTSGVATGLDIDDDVVFYGGVIGGEIKF